MGNQDITTRRGRFGPVAGTAFSRKPHHEHARGTNAAWALKPGWQLIRIHQDRRESTVNRSYEYVAKGVLIPIRLPVLTNRLGFDTTLSDAGAGKGREQQPVAVI